MDDIIIYKTLVKYMAEILEQEGISYLHDPSSGKFYGSHYTYTSEEIEILNKAYKDALEENN